VLLRFDVMVLELDIMVLECVDRDLIFLVVF